MPPAITEGDIMVMMIRVEAGQSSGAEGTWLFHHDGKPWNRGKAA